MIQPPIKPFPSYKWRWAVLTPTESLNDPPVFLGVLRVFDEYRDFAPSSEEVMRGLSIVQQETGTNVDLVRTRERNLVRNSGQYWRALGLLDGTHGRISVSHLGHMLATGEITQVEFATVVIKTLELPNRQIENPAVWDSVGLAIKPLQLILDILSSIGRNYSSDASYITPFELVKIVIPLAGSRASINDYGHAVTQFRLGSLDISAWPDCAPSSNDRRMAREFLIFLSKYGFLSIDDSLRGNDNEKYYLASISKEEILELSNTRMVNYEMEDVVRMVRETQIPASIERKRVSREILERPFQNLFRKNILIAYEQRCLVTGVEIDNVLEAAHIIDVKYNGSDRIENGLCLRSDIHQLFDSGNLKIKPNGDIALSPIAANRNNYGGLPRKIQIPDFVSKDNLEWRFKYT